MFPSSQENLKIASFKLSDPHPPSTPSRFCFSLLPYDIRGIVYYYYDTDPPLTPRVNSLGLYLSCHHVKTELDELVPRRFKDLYTEVSNKCGLIKNIQPDPDNLGNITINLPYTAFHDVEPSFQGPRWKLSVLRSLHPLFALHLDTIRIHLSSKDCLESILPSPTVAFQNTTRNLLRDLVSLIDYTNIDDPETRSSNAIEQIFKREETYDDHMKDCPTAKIRVKRLGLSWDLRSSSQEREVQLAGRMNYLSEVRTDRRGTFLHRRIVSKQEHPPAPHPDAADPKSQVKGYILRDADNLVGEMGVISLTRWVWKQPTRKFVSRLVENYTVWAGPIISSGGLGEEIVYGLGGMEKKEFQEMEKRIDRKWNRMQTGG
jgi:hypothetical protein